MLTGKYRPQLFLLLFVHVRSSVLPLASPRSLTLFLYPMPPPDLYIYAVYVYVHVSLADYYFVVCMLVTALCILFITAVALHEDEPRVGQEDGVPLLRP